MKNHNINWAFNIDNWAFNIDRGNVNNQAL